MTVEKLLRDKKNSYLTIEPDYLTKSAVDKFSTSKAGALIVSENGISVEGIITEHDIIRGLESRGAVVLESPVKNLMTSEVITCQVTDPVSLVMALMVKHRIKHLPVVDGNIICGLVSMQDIVALRIEEIQHEADIVRQHAAVG